MCCDVNQSSLMMNNDKKSKASACVGDNLSGIKKESSCERPKKRIICGRQIPELNEGYRRRKRKECRAEMSYEDMSGYCCSRYGHVRLVAKRAMEADAAWGAE
jgi:hypothetical protein